MSIKEGNGIANGSQGTVTLLGSGNSLGVYVPVIQLSRQLSGRGIPVEVCVLEDLYFDVLQHKLATYKKAFHDSFAVAKKGAELARDSAGNFDPVKVSKLLDMWEQEKRSSFIAATGFWLPIIEQYQLRLGARPLGVQFLHLDADYSPSYLVYGNRADPYSHIWFYGNENSGMTHRIAISEELPIPFSQREERYLVHGGGWGIGTYRSAAQELIQSGKRLNVLAYYDEDLIEQEEFHYYRNDPAWSPWVRDERGRMQFPPLARVKLGQAPCYHNCEQYPLLFRVIRKLAAIISKPGGYSLMESLASATPLVFLEPFGKHEASNARFWIKQGYGIRYEDWKAEHFAMDVLEPLHENLVQASNQLIDYGGEYDAAQNE